MHAHELSLPSRWRQLCHVVVGNQEPSHLSVRLWLTPVPKFASLGMTNDENNKSEGTCSAAGISAPEHITATNAAIPPSLCTATWFSGQWLHRFRIAMAAVLAAMDAGSACQTRSAQGRINQVQGLLPTPR